MYVNGIKIVFKKNLKFIIQDCYFVNEYFRVHPQKAEKL